MTRILVSFFVFFAMTSAGSAASLTSYTNQASFEAELDLSYTFIDLVTGPLSTGSNVVTTHDPRFLPTGLDIISIDPRGALAQSAGFYPGVQQTPVAPGLVPILLNGSSTVDTSDDFAANIIGGAHGFGYVSNMIDGGHIEFYAGEDLTGPLLGTVFVDGSGGFFGGVSDMLFRSVRVTCEFNFDNTCGMTDLQFGTASPSVPAVPLPASGLLLLGALMGFGSLRRRIWA